MNDLDTITQLFAAIYITLAVDIQFFQRFWSQTYYRTVTEIIDKYNFNKSTKLQQKLLSDIRKQAISWETSSRKRGILMFCYCLIVLIYATFETPTDSDGTHEYIRVILFSFFTFIVALFSHKLLNSWLSSLITGGLLLCLLLIAYQETFIKHFPNALNIANVELTKIIILCTLGTPILWQLFSNWLYSTVYTKYLVKLLNKEADDYKATIIAKRERDSSKLPESYKSVMASLHISGETDEDVQITEINNVLNQRLKKACKYPSFFTLLKNISQKGEDISPIDEDELRGRLNYNEPVTNRPPTNNSSNPSQNPDRNTHSQKSLLRQRQGTSGRKRRKK